MPSAIFIIDASVFDLLQFVKLIALKLNIFLISSLKSFIRLLFHHLCHLVLRALQKQKRIDFF